jgi:hypothetical protein
MQYQPEEIPKLIEEVRERQDLQTKALLSQMESGFNAINTRIDNVVEQKKIQNGRIGKTEVRVKKIEDSRAVWNFIERRPKLTIAISIISVMGIVYISKQITLVEIIKSIF